MSILRAINFTPEYATSDTSGAIRFGMGAIKNVGATAVEAIVKARAEGGRFKSIFDFCDRVDPAAVNRRVLESLVKAGAMDSLHGTRSQFMTVLDSAIETGLRAWRDRASGQSGLFADLLSSTDHEPNTRCPTSRTSPATRSCRPKKRCSASTSPAIRSINTWIK